MKGYPKNINTKVDFENLLSMPEYKARALADLGKIKDAGDSSATKVIGDPEDAKSINIITNPSPLWKLKGFKSREELDTLVKEVK